MLEIKNPYTQRTINSILFNSESDVETSFQIACRTFKDLSKHLSKNQKLNILKNFTTLLETHKEEIIHTAISEGGKPITDTIIEHGRAIQGVLIAMDCMHKNEGTVIPMGLSASSQKHVAYTKNEPIGPVFCICAFNHPINLIIHQIIPAFVAGCPVILKPALKTPLTAQLLIKLFHQAGCPEEWCQILITPNDITEKMASDKRIAFLSFIGSEKIGWKLRSQLAPGVQCTLEHGGVAPLILTEETNLTKNIPRIIKGAFYHAGQVCVSTQRLYIPEELCATVIEKLLIETDKIVTGDPQNEATLVGPIITPEALKKIDTIVQEAINSGGKLLCGGNTTQNTCYLPTIILNPSDTCRLSTEELFGPVLAIYTYKTIEEAIQRANDLPYCFQAAVMGENPEITHYVAEKLKARTVLINDHTAFRVDWMPFGGAELSGVGTGGIPYSIKELQREKLYVVNYN